MSGRDDFYRRDVSIPDFAPNDINPFTTLLYLAAVGAKIYRGLVRRFFKLMHPSLDQDMSRVGWDWVYEETLEAEEAFGSAPLGWARTDEHADLLGTLALMLFLTCPPDGRRLAWKQANGEELIAKKTYCPALLGMQALSFEGGSLGSAGARVSALLLVSGVQDHPCYVMFREKLLANWRRGLPAGDEL